MGTMIRRNSLNISFGKWRTSSSPGAVENGSPGSPSPPVVTRKGSSSFGSSVAIQKLRESKWFDAGEERIFCAVIEDGFLVELRHPVTGESWYGVAAIETKKCEYLSMAGVSSILIPMHLIHNYNEIEQKSESITIILPYTTPCTYTTQGFLKIDLAPWTRTTANSFYAVCTEENTTST